MNQKFTLDSSCARLSFLKIAISSILVFTFSTVFSQKISTEEILNLVSCPLKKLDNVMHRRGFVYNGRINYHDTSAIIFGQRKPDSTRKQIEYF
ncbi:MAG TPA: hypothetical protein VGO09_04705, partial [Flavisolibacter sp.]|nr:hypothetical protein [Flavisolibacter sp.]